MLTHRNFAALVAKLGGAFDLGVGDGVLSVLPLHHTFEFSAGFLTPFSRGAEVAYLDELTSDRIGEVLEGGNITGLVGVPALWQLFHRKITQEFATQPKFIEEAMKGLMSINAELRNRQGINLGKLLFWPVHRKFGGNIKFLISGGSALPDDVHKAFHALGFTLDEGYGLTEAAPVLTVTHAGNKRLPGTVGKALPGVELKIDEPDNDGIGEVIARGPNVMAGYFQDRESTAAVLKDGWLHTGDLGPHRRRRQPLPGRPPQGRHHRCQREERVPGRARGALRRAPARQGAERGRPARRERRREGRCPRACPTTRTARATRCAASWRSTSASCPPTSRSTAG